MFKRRSDSKASYIVAAYFGGVLTSWLILNPVNDLHHAKGITATTSCDTHPDTALLQKCDLDLQNLKNEEKIR